MPAKKKVKPPVPAVNPAPAPNAAANPKEQQLANLVSAFSSMLNLCFDLHRDGRLTTDQQNAFWILANRGLLVMIRYDPMWMRIIANDPPTIGVLQKHTDLAKSAVDALQLAKATPSDTRITIAVGKTATTIDEVDAMLDAIP